MFSGKETILQKAVLVLATSSPCQVQVFLMALSLTYFYKEKAWVAVLDLKDFCRENGMQGWVVILL
jgi:hypothetical protein